MIKIIAACSSNGIIGVNNCIPFHYPEDLKHFKTSTLNSTIIMGRKTYESIGSKPLPNRKNIVISKNKIENIETYSNLKDALNDKEDIWLIGGASIYQEGMEMAQEIILTITPDHIYDAGAIKFPWINPILFKINEITQLGDNGLRIVKYIKI